MPGRPHFPSKPPSPGPSPSRHELDQLRSEEADALPRIGTRPIATPADLTRRLECLALAVGEMLAQAQSAKDPHWWRLADLLDDAMDCVEAARKDERIARGEKDLLESEIPEPGPGSKPIGRL